MNDIKGIIEDVEKSSLVSDKVIKKVIEIIGQEEWNDIHDEKNNICTTTGELIIVLKGVADLENCNQELLNSCEGATMMYKDLCKAKEIIKEMLSILPKENIEGIYEITEQAEQFLNSEVVEKMTNEELKLKYCSRCVNSDCDLDCIAKQEAPYDSFICNDGEMFEEYKE